MSGPNNLEEIKNLAVEKVEAVSRREKRPKLSTVVVFGGEFQNS
jgi:hypothetical protein